MSEKGKEGKNKEKMCFLQIEEGGVCNLINSRKNQWGL